MGREVQVSADGVYDLGYHVVWYPKYRRPVRAKAAGHGWRIIALEVMPGHARLFVKAHPEHFPSYIANQLKGFTSHTLRAGFPHLRTRLPTLWPESYFAAPVGAVSAATVRRYIGTRYQRPGRKEPSR